MLKGKQQCRIYELSTTPNVLKEQHPKLEIKLALFSLDFPMCMSCIFHFLEKQTTKRRSHAKRGMPCPLRRKIIIMMYSKWQFLPIFIDNLRNLLTIIESFWTIVYIIRIERVNPTMYFWHG